MMMVITSKCVWKVKSFHVIFMVMEISIIILLILIF